MSKRILSLGHIIIRLLQRIAPLGQRFVIRGNIIALPGPQIKGHCWLFIIVSNIKSRRWPGTVDSMRFRDSYPLVFLFDTCSVLITIKFTFYISFSSCKQVSTDFENFGFWRPPSINKLQVDSFWNFGIFKMYRKPSEVVKSLNIDIFKLRDHS